MEGEESSEAEAQRRRDEAARRLGDEPSDADASSSARPRHDATVERGDTAEQIDAAMAADGDARRPMDDQPASRTPPSMEPPAEPDDQPETGPATEAVSAPIEPESGPEIPIEPEPAPEPEPEPERTPPPPPPTAAPSRPAGPSFIDRAWETQYKVEARFKKVGRGKYSRVLKMARKPEKEEFVRASQITAIGIAIVGMIGFGILLFMGWLMDLLGVA